MFLHAGHGRNCGGKWSYIEENIVKAAKITKGVEYESEHETSLAYSHSLLVSCVSQVQQFLLLLNDTTHSFTLSDLNISPV